MYDQKQEEKKSGIKKYLLGIAATFAIGVAAGTVFSPQIKYAFWKTEKFFIKTDQALGERMPEAVQKYDRAVQYALRGLTEEEAKQKKKEFIADLDEKIRKYEQE